MEIKVVLVLSIMIQFSAALYALKLIKITGLKYSWIFISFSLFLMGCRRAISLYLSLPGINFNPSLINESIGLVLSAFMLFGIRGIEPVFIERIDSEREIKKLLSEKETLFRELFHRTKNIMQVIRGLIILQAAEYSTNSDVQNLIQATNNRIDAISLVHHKLYQSNDLSRISIQNYIEELSDLIIKGFTDSKKNITLNIQVDDQLFLHDIVVPIGLILNELITNSLKHAFPEQNNGLVSISFTKTEPDKFLLKYSDNGIGVSDSFDYINQKTLGLTLIREIAENQLQGKVKMNSNNGLHCSIEFQNNLYSVRV